MAAYLSVRESGVVSGQCLLAKSSLAGSSLQSVRSDTRSLLEALKHDGDLLKTMSRDIPLNATKWRAPSPDPTLARAATTASFEGESANPDLEVAARYQDYVTPQYTVRSQS